MQGLEDVPTSLWSRSSQHFSRAVAAGASRGSPLAYETCQPALTDALIVDSVQRQRPAYPSPRLVKAGPG
jgi:hypothetical protein